MSEEEILTLHTLTEEEQTDWLIKNKVLIRREHLLRTDKETESPYVDTAEGWESLADCAFRLRDEVEEYYMGHKELHGYTYPLYTAMYEVEMLVNGSASLNIAFWVYRAKPIHWIQAALLAKETKK